MKTGLEGDENEYNQQANTACSRAGNQQHDTGEVAIDATLCPMQERG